jgi:hypothetical protein
MSVVVETNGPSMGENCHTLAARLRRIHCRLCVALVTNRWVRAFPARVIELRWDALVR